MTLTIHLPPDIEADLVAQARAQGLDLSRYVEHVLREQVPRPGSVLSPSERAEAWRQSTRGLPRTPPLSDDAISRESIYGDRG
jgi:post-segregation antitoxin (ccd killing protein)